MAATINNPAVGTRWRDKTLHDLTCTVIEDVPFASPGQVTFQIDSLAEPSIWDTQAFLEAMELIEPESDLCQNQ